MPPKLNELIHLGVEQFQAGNLLGAEYFLNEALKVEPENFDVNLILGLIKASQSDASNAIHFFSKALEIRPHSAPAVINLAQAYQASGDGFAAIEIYQKATKSHPENLEILFGLATILGGEGQESEARKIYKKILELKPDAIEARLNLAAMLADMGDYVGALAVLGAADKKAKTNKTYWSNLAAIYIGLKSWQEAEECIKKAIQIDDKDPLSLVRGGEITLANGNTDQAKEYFEKAISFAPDMAEAWAGLGNVMIDLNQDNDAEVALNKSIELDPKNAVAWCAKGILSKEIGNYDAAIEYLEIGRELAPLMPEINNNIAHLNLRKLNFSEGWKDYESRWNIKAFNSKRLFSDERLWMGGALNGALLVWGEQGIGDQILYSSMLEMLSRKFPSIIVMLDQRLLPIFRSSMPQITFLPLDADVASIPFEKHISLGSLGQYLLGSVDAFNNRKYPYLFADEAIKSQIVSRSELEGRIICGLSWTSKASKYSDDKSFSLNDLQPVLEMDSLTFLDVGYVNSEKEREFIRSEHGYEIHKITKIDSYNDLDGLAALIDSCSFIITCSNTCAHLAGALGKKVFLLVPEFRGRFWYWSDVRGTSLWYPSITVIPKNTNEDWVSVAQRVRRLVEEFTGG